MALWYSIDEPCHYDKFCIIPILFACALSWKNRFGDWIEKLAIKDFIPFIKIKPAHNTLSLPRKKKIFYNLFL